MALERSSVEGGKDPLRELGGTALQVYLYMLLRGDRVGVREVQRALGFRSPSTARHHLERLVALGLAVKTEDGYIAVRPREGLLSLYTFYSGKAIPRTIAVLAGLIAYTVYIATIDPLLSIPLTPILALVCYELYVEVKALKSLIAAKNRGRKLHSKT
ncbi:MAG TPA: hypothetical protein EYP08_01955 [Pyrodictiaceae archaeon]|nr:hypothetical protein [Pyrodictiaceae archaeon]HIP85108.1 hypothetical protein [Pyrodictium sp.]HIQ55785.1 hypothetical protein [Pyrodictium sp.]